MKSKWRWHSDESTCLPPTWLGFKSRCQRHMWAGFVVANLSFTLRDFSLATLLSPSPQKPTLPNSNLTSWNSRQRPWLCGYATPEKNHYLLCVRPLAIMFATELFVDLMKKCRNCGMVMVALETTIIFELT